MSANASIEYEAKFLDVDHDWARRELTKLGGVCVAPSRQMRRTNLDYADLRLKKIHSWVRLRDEGDKVTLTFKTNHSDRRVDGIHELETTVSDYEETLSFLHAIGMVDKSYQETFRESWRVDDDVQIELDRWPWLPPLLEIEGHDEGSVRATAAKLGLDWSSALFGPIHTAYRSIYDVTQDEVNELPQYRFEASVPWPTRS